jgi:malate permease and related proteins
MWEAFVLALNVVFPLTGLISLGYLARRFRLVQSEVLEGMNQLVFKLLLPAALMRSILRIDFSESIDLSVFVLALVLMSGLILVAMPLVERVEHDPRRQAVLVQGTFRSNFILFGLPIATAYYANIGIIALMLALMVPIINLYAILVLEHYRNRGATLNKVFLKILMNPLFLGSAAGGLIVLSGIMLPQPVLRLVDYVADMATPLALLTLGGLFSLRSVHKNLKPTLILTGLKLIVVPLIAIGLGLALGLRQRELMGLLLLFGSPVAVSSYSMAVAMDCDGELANHLVVTTTLFSLVSFVIWIFLFRVTNLI